MEILDRNGAETSLRKPHRPSVGEIEVGVAALAQRVEDAIEQIGRDIPISDEIRQGITAILIEAALASLRNGSQLELALEASND